MSSRRVILQVCTSPKIDCGGGSFSMLLRKEKHHSHKIFIFLIFNLQVPFPGMASTLSPGKTAHAVLILKDLLDRELHYLKCLQGLVHVHDRHPSLKRKKMCDFSRYACSSSCNLFAMLSYVRGTSCFHADRHSGKPHPHATRPRKDL